MSTMFRWCRRCGHAFTPKTAGDRLCGRCSPDPVPFERDPIDLRRQWS